jgi:serine/threonine-protein kinase HipA
MSPYPAPTYGVSLGSDNNAAGVCAARVVAACAMSPAGLPRLLTGNSEVHAKNMSLVATSKGQWPVAPTCEVPSTPASGDHPLAMRVGFKRDGLSRRQPMALADRVGLRGRAGRESP